MKRNLRFLLFSLGMLSILSSCSQADRGKSDSSDSLKGKTSKDGILVGEMSVIIDEAILPIMKQQVEVFKSSYKDGSIKLVALPEREAINALIQGKASMAVLGRLLTKDENAGFTQRNITPREFPVFHDGVVFVNNIASADTSINKNALSSLLKGETVGKKLLLDNINSSTVRRIKEFAGVDKISSQSVKAMKNADELLKQLESDQSSIGVLSYGQFLEYREKFGVENKIRILSLQSLDEKGVLAYFKPSQTTFATNEYGIKTTFNVLNYQPNMGLGIGFSAFLTGDRGQRVVLKSGLLPATMPGREIIIRDN